MDSRKGGKTLVLIFVFAVVGMFATAVGLGIGIVELIWKVREVYKDVRNYQRASVLQSDLDYWKEHAGEAMELNRELVAKLEKIQRDGIDNARHAVIEFLEEEGFGGLTHWLYLPDSIARIAQIQDAMQADDEIPVDADEAAE